MMRMMIKVRSVPVNALKAIGGAEV
jgi:hypothetical protein